jgi:rhamnosyltransferase
MSSVTVGIISYNPDIPALEALLSTLDGDGVHLLVVDNGSDNADQLERMLARRADVEFLPQGANTGVAAAINRVYREAEKLQTRYMLVADQDSIFQEDHIARLLGHFQAMEEHLPRLGACGGRIYDVHRKRLHPFKTFRFPWQQKPPALPAGFHHADFLISSGTLVLMDCLRDVGAMNEWLFIDSVDLDWCFRASDRDWQLLGCDEPVIKQSFGSGVLAPGGIFSGIGVHDPERYFTMTRNRLFLYRQAYSHWAWRLRDLARACLKFCFLVLFSSQRKSILSAHWRGLCAAHRTPGTGEGKIEQI